MKFGIILTPHWSGETSQKDVLDDMVDRMVQAESLGYWSAWTTEHHFGNDPTYVPFGWEKAKFRAYDLACDPLSLLTFVAARTTRLRLGTGVLVMHYDHPLRVAERAAMLDIFSRGRLELGIGKGSVSREYVVFGAPEDAESSQEKFLEEVDILLKAWSGKPFSFDGKYFKFPEIEVVPKPLQTPIPSLFLGSVNPQNLKFAAQNGLSYASTTGSWGYSAAERHNTLHQVYLDSAHAAGRDTSATLFPTTLFLFCAETDQEAEEVAEEYLMRFSAHVEGHYERQRRGAAFITIVNTPSGGPTKGGATLADVRELAKKQIESNLIGSPKTICEKLEVLLQKVPSINYVLGITDAGSPPRTFVTRSMELFAREVMPRFTSRNPASPQNLRQSA